jgi:hypothetical protein
MPCFLLTFGDASRPPVGAVIIEAPSMFQARMTPVVRRLAPGVPFGEGLKLSAAMQAPQGSISSAARLVTEPFLDCGVAWEISRGKTETGASFGRGTNFRPDEFGEKCHMLLHMSPLH